MVRNAIVAVGVIASAITIWQVVLPILVPRPLPDSVRIQGLPRTVDPGRAVSFSVLVQDRSGAPVAGAQVVLASSNGGFTDAARHTLPAVTNASGYVEAEWRAPAVVAEPAARITARASKDGQSREDSVLVGIGSSPEPRLKVQFDVETPRLPARASTSVRVFVTAESGEPVAGAKVVLTSDGGEFASGTPSMTDNTDQLGTFKTTWTMPSGDRSRYELTAAIEKPGFASLSQRRSVEKESPPMSLEVQWDVPARVRAGMTANVNLTVRSQSGPVHDATITLTADGGNFATSGGKTRHDGTFATTWTMPRDGSDAYVITAVVQKSGYRAPPEPERRRIERERAPWSFKVLPPPIKPLEARLEAFPELVRPGVTTSIEVKVSSQGRPVADADVTLEASAGRFVATAGTQASGRTAAEGVFRAAFVMPAGSQSPSIRASARKQGHDPASASKSLTPDLRDPCPHPSNQGPGTGNDFTATVWRRSNEALLELLERSKFRPGSEVGPLQTWRARVHDMAQRVRQWLTEDKAVVVFFDMEQCEFRTLPTVFAGKSAEFPGRSHRDEMNQTWMQDTTCSLLFFSPPGRCAVLELFANPRFEGGPKVRLAGSSAVLDLEVEFKQRFDLIGRNGISSFRIRER